MSRIAITKKNITFSLQSTFKWKFTFYFAEFKADIDLNF